MALINVMFSGGGQVGHLISQAALSLPLIDFLPQQSHWARGTPTLPSPYHNSPSAAMDVADSL